MCTYIFVGSERGEKWLYNVAICDDEWEFLDSTKQICSKILTQNDVPFKITTFFDPNELLEVLEENPEKYNIILLDILMGKTNGIEFAKILRENGNSVSIIFITSSLDFAIDGYDVFPVHYIIKPLDEYKLEKALLKDYESNFKKKKVVVATKSGDSLIYVDDINYIESLKRNVTIHTEQNNIEYIGTLKSVQQLLVETNIIKCHKSFLINLDKVKDITRQEITLHNNEKIPIGRNYYSDIYYMLTKLMTQKLYTNI